MTTATLPAPPAATPVAARPVPFRWTADEFYRIGDAGWFEGRKLILLDGEILEMPAPGPMHMTAMGLTDNWLRTAFPAATHWVRNQGGLTLAQDTDPVPDFAVVPGTPRAYSKHPRTALLVIEVADTSVAYDTGDKASLYAAAGITDYWVIDVVDMKIRVFRDPAPDPPAKYGHAYRQVTVCGPTDRLAPLAAPHAAVDAADLLP